ncbi:mitogen-activated protein kinase kinase STE7 [Maudiozyma barnettii]|uniref:mitogen-activated protein kinase kinase n=1 Tax=Maudiozyma barnettii TaxID=61262 RepID=A0A8H2VBF6_9SACH|nr:mitogen-activated protein kinase kinase STE7 [Kazachstania barnettii]CAB4252195.1 similar to Saccharomyces cerevisiae YDL159W STE7 Signal transducing MAP kinase kinase involved in pheromone response [Kazachstania barnettii]
MKNNMMKTTAMTSEEKYVSENEPTKFQGTSLVRKNLKHLKLEGSTTDEKESSQMMTESGARTQSNNDINISAMSNNLKLNMNSGGLYAKRGIKKKLTLNSNNNFRGGNGMVPNNVPNGNDHKVIIQQKSINDTLQSGVSSLSLNDNGTNQSSIQSTTLSLPANTDKNSSSLISHIIARSQQQQQHIRSNNYNNNRSPQGSPKYNRDNVINNIDNRSSNVTHCNDNKNKKMTQGNNDDSTPLKTMSAMPNITRTQVPKHRKASQYQLQDLVQLGKIGSGNSGTVLKVLHVPTSTIISKKVIPIEKNNDIINKQLLSELQIMKNIQPHPNIITFYGAYLKQSVNYDIIILMEYMDCGSLDKILRVFKNFVKRDQQQNPLFKPRTTWFNIPSVMSKISFAVLSGLNYLYTYYKIIHRDIKPSNVLVNGKGSVKICDFGVSKKLINSVADTFVGTSTYMSPERIQGNGYSVKGDVWSLGLMVIELITGDFPLGGHNDTPRGILDLLQRIVNEPAPTLPNEETFSRSLKDFVDRCCVKEAKDRGSINELLQHEFITHFNNNIDGELNEKYDIEFKRWCRKIKYKAKVDKQIRRDMVERAKFEKLKLQQVS